MMSSCRQNTRYPPLNDDTFTAVMVDIHLLEAQLENLRQASNTVICHMAGKEYEAIYEKHGINKELFRKTFDYYLQRPKEMDKVYEKIVEALSEREAKLKE